MPLVDAGRNAMLTGGLGNAVAYISLHTGDPSTTGANESTGGTPAYARQAVTWNAAASGQRTNSGALTFDLPASTIYHIGLFSAVTAGTFYGYFPLGGGAPQAATVLASSDVFTSYAHGYTTDDRILVFDVQNVGVPTGITEGTVYFVRATGLTTDVFTLATTSGGASIAITTDGEVFVQKVVPETFGAQGQFQIASGNLSLDARLA